MVFIGDSVTCDLPVANYYGIKFLPVLTGIHTAQNFIDAGVSDTDILSSIASLLEG